MLIGVRSLQNGGKSFHRKKNFKYLQVSSGVSFVVTQLWNLNYVHRLFCFVLEFFFNLLFKSGVWFGLHNIFSVLSDPVGTAAQCFSCPVCGSESWTRCLLLKEQICDLSSALKKLTDNFLLRALLPVIYFFDSFLSFLPLFYFSFLSFSLL